MPHQIRCLELTKQKWDTCIFFHKDTEKKVGIISFVELLKFSFVWF